MELWRDLARTSQDKSKGLGKTTFSNYHDLSGIIGDRLLAIFDQNHDGYLKSKEFLQEMTVLFSESFASKFIFEFYAFDRDGIITKDTLELYCLMFHFKRKECWYLLPR